MDPIFLSGLLFTILGGRNSSERSDALLNAPSPQTLGRWTDKQGATRRLHAATRQALGKPLNLANQNTLSES